ncbi:AAA family ATPase [Paenibacillus eucommiae]|uniref:ATPase/signal transduction histidine kinase n=1 Tax=Paenibacillus eucommiae TaxID=1355755 RepID=A0ABS4J6R1_9BACL|nr:AAA family ATPase [Paenibacillus eucommiae]MBP1995544.1 putative ATPase/signal transduction histidine kinase [Paenibacillus eucommiae]
MLKLPGYRTIECIGESSDTFYYRCIHIKEGIRVIAITTRDEYPGEKAIASYKSEYEVLGKLDGGGAVKPVCLEWSGHRPVLLVEDFNGIPLSQLIRNRSHEQLGSATEFSMHNLLDIASKLAGCLKQIHRKHIVHNAIYPFHILINTRTMEVKLAGFRQSSHLHEHPVHTEQSNLSIEMLPYMSPEQTGRVNRMSDYRTDFYSLGVTLYEWFTGSLPFYTKDALELIHSHIAGMPLPLNERDPLIPLTVSELVLKCMQKAPEARYRSAFSIETDLLACMDQWSQTGNVVPFELADQDESEQLHISPIMYGRRKEKEQLLQARERISSGKSEFVLVSGQAGIGKTTFIRDTLRKQASYGLLISGKFAPFQSDTPYSAWKQAIEELVAQLLTGKEREIELWKLRIMEGIGDYGQLLVELVPQLELLIGPQPHVPNLPAMEAQNRFHLILNRFIHVFADAGHPLIIFLDDLQWADDASLQFINQLMLYWQSQYLLLIGACREEELELSHPMDQLKDLWVEKEKQVVSIRLFPLEAEDIKLLLADTMGTTSGNLEELTAVMMLKTDGHPFYIKPFLQHAYDQGFVTFQGLDRSWQWDLQQMSGIEATGRAIGYLSSKLDGIPLSTRRLLSWAAFLGRKFDLELLTQLTSLSLTEAAAGMEQAVKAGLLHAAGSSPSGAAAFVFQHDRILQDLYSLVPEEERASWHRQVGQLLKSRLHTHSQQEMLLFEVVKHLNAAISCIRNEAERRELAVLNDLAGQKAKQSTAYEAALRYYRQATMLLEEKDWQTDYEAMYQTFQERAICEFLCANFDEADKLFEALLQKSDSDLRSAQLYITIIELESNQYNYHKVIDLGHKALQLLQVRQLPETTNISLLRHWLRIQWKLRGRSVESLRSLPPMTDPRYLAAIAVFTSMGVVYFMYDRQSWASSILVMLELTLDYGCAPESSIAYVGMAILHTMQTRKYKDAYKWGMLACEMSESHPRVRAITINAFSICYDSWRRYDPDLYDRFVGNIERTRLETGSLWHVNMSILFASAIALFLGKPIEGAYQLIVNHAYEIKRNHSSRQFNSAVVLAQLFVRLTGEPHDNDPFTDIDVYDESFTLIDQGKHDQGLLDGIYFMSYLTSYLFGRYKEAYIYVLKADKLNEGRKKGEYEYGAHGMYYVLIMAALYDSVSPQEQRQFLKLMQHYKNHMKRIAKRCPENYKHKYLLLAAEISRVTRLKLKAERLYEEAYVDAEKHGHVHNMAIASECAGKFHLGQGNVYLAAVCMTRAHQAYLNWGAKAKAADLEARFKHLLLIDNKSPVDGIDYYAVMKSVQAISQEVVMEKLLDTLMRILLQNAGAERGALIFEQEHVLFVEAYGTAGHIELASEMLDSTDKVSTAIVGYVARTMEEIVLEDASSEGLFTNSTYVQKRKLKSVVCMPIVKNNQMVCILYLENNMSAGVFTHGRMDVLKLLCSQCAISIDNARLYTNIERLKNSLEDQVKERTRTLEHAMEETAAALTQVSIQSERNRISAEVHDIVGHALTSSILQIEAGKRQLHTNKEDARVRLQNVQDQLRHSLSEIRRSVHMLKQGESFDLKEELLKLIRNTEHQANVSIHVTIKQIPELTGVYNHVIYHALQEGLTNGIRHGAADIFHFTLKTEGNLLVFRLEDNGEGADQINPGFGLTAMRDRVEGLGGNLYIEPVTGQGCLLQIVIPYLL